MIWITVAVFAIFLLLTKRLAATATVTAVVSVVFLSGFWHVFGGVLFDSEYWSAVVAVLAVCLTLWVLCFLIALVYRCTLARK
jgi:hypothetical protein